MKYFFALALILLLIMSCTTPPEKNSCCQECLTSASQDPAGYDISIKECSKYELSEGCREYFQQKEVRVGDCREMEK